MAEYAHFSHGRSRSVKKELSRPSVEQLEKALEKEQYRKSYGRVLRSTFFALVSVAAVAVLIVMLWMPVLRIIGTSMEPTLEDGQIAVAFKGTDFERGDIVAFYYGNKLLVKRYIAGPGEWVNIDEDGNVFVNGTYLEEPYLTEKALGDCNIDLPYQVPDEKYFLIGDHRATSLDSRSTEVGCVAEEQLVGRIVFCVWPLNGIGTIDGARLDLSGLLSIFNK